MPTLSSVSPAAGSGPGSGREILSVLHLVSGPSSREGQVSGEAVHHPLLTHVLSPQGRGALQMRLAAFHSGSAYASVIRQSGVPVHELSLSSRRLSPGAPGELFGLVRKHRPQVLHAWGLSAQIVAALLARVSSPKPVVLWSVSDTKPPTDSKSPLGKVKLAAQRRLTASAARVIYLSEAALAHHRRAGYDVARAQVIPAGLDVDRYKPDFAARQRVRKSLEIPADAFVVGMHAPFLPEFDHATLIKAVAESMRSHPRLYLVLAGRGVQRGNATLMALLSGTTLSARSRLLGEWSDQGALFAACDAVCSSALNDRLRMNLAMAMLCGAMCVGTGLGAQGEVIGQHGIAVEPGSEIALVRALTRLLTMPNDRRAFLAQQARKDALGRFNLATSLERYRQLYAEVCGS